MEGSVEVGSEPPRRKENGPLPCSPCKGADVITHAFDLTPDQLKSLEQEKAEIAATYSSQATFSAKPYSCKEIY